MASFVEPSTAPEKAAPTPRRRPFDARFAHPGIRLAMRILENEQQAIPSSAVLAARVGLSSAHFSRLFAAQLGEASSAYGRRIRLDHSVNRLRYDPASIGEVAEDFGYVSHAAFTRAFTEQFGCSPRDYMQHVAPDAAGEAPLPLPGPVRLVSHPPMRLAARRFFGADAKGFWQKFMGDLPSDFPAGAACVGLSYDDPSVTPDRHQRYDCCLALGDIRWQPEMMKLGLDLIELPGGHYGEVSATASIDTLRSLVTSLFVEWMPTRPTLLPEGDPFPMFFASPPVDKATEGRVAIRVRHRQEFPAANARALGEKRIGS